MSPSAATPKCSVVVLTMGDRNRELDELMASVALDGHEGVLVSNGEPTPIPERPWPTVVESVNLGISGGRRRGADAATGQYLVFLDDDAMNLTPGLLDRIAQAFDDDPELGAIALRVVVEGTDASLSEWLPRLRGRGELVPGRVTSFHGAAHAVRSSAYVEAGGYPDHFWYAHEETDLAWRLLDRGWNIDYRPDLVLSHPFAKPRRHDRALWFSARNRVWLARRHLPWSLAAVYVSVWLAIQVARCRSLAEVASVVRGSATGMRHPAGERRPIRWATARRMAELGRPPII